MNVNPLETMKSVTCYYETIEDLRIQSSYLEQMANILNIDKSRN